MFGKRLRKYRKRKKLSQQALGQMIAKPQTTISDWETGKMLPDIIETAKIAAVLNIKVSDLLDETKGIVVGAYLTYENKG